MRSYVYESEGLKVSQICDIGIKLCNILEYLHNYKDGIIHLDIKPDNIIIDENNNVKLIDFGNALYDGEVSVLSMLSPGYAAPEQYQNRKLTHSADIYSVGMVLMFMADVESQCNNKVNKISSVRSDLSRIRHNRLYPIIKKCTRHKPELRYRSIEALRRELEKTNKQLKFNKKSDHNSHSYVIKISGSRRGVGVTHIVLSMAYIIAGYGIKCVVVEASKRSDILEIMQSGELGKEGFFIYKGVWFAIADKVQYDVNSLSKFKVIIVDEGTVSEHISYGIGEDYNNIICSLNDYDYKMINIIVAGGKYGIKNECSIIEKTRHDTLLMVNLLSETQFYIYVNHIVKNRICYRMPCVYNWYQYNEEWISVMNDFIQDNLPQVWENIITDTKKEKCNLLYEKLCQKAWIIWNKTFEYLKKCIRCISRRSNNQTKKE